jgi:hypothetical protein
METSFFSGSENLYKYLVTVGTLLVMLTVYYPLKEKQELEILSLKVKNELQILSCKLDENKKELDNFKKSNSDKNISKELKRINFEKIKEVNLQNSINQLTIENKNNEINCRKVYINIYNFVFWIFFPVGIFLIVFGFIKWNRTKKVDDKILELEKSKLELEVQNLQNQNSNSSNP